ncbi:MULTISPECIES: hypothetical protein [Providencia]|uniref:phage tail fiber protein n=1 Tax=Providencia TaxID=586 RepID=UPI001EE89845|nr:hypothetical protein [Providencia huaxiensis]
MIYEIGTISTKASDPKITGKNTLWKNSVTKVSVGQIILIQSGDTIYQNSIRSVESDIQMTLSFPVPATLTDVKYVISITMIGSVSDGVNKATAMITESYQLMMILNRLMTESGVIKVVLPDGTEMQLRTEKERDRLLDGKLDKAGGDVNGRLDVASVVVASQLVAKTPKESRIQLNPIDAGPRIESRTEGGAWRIYALPETGGTLMKVGDFGVGALSINNVPKELDLNANKARALGFFYINPDAVGTPSGRSEYGGGVYFGRDPAVSSNILYSPDWSSKVYFRTPIGASAMSGWYEFYTTGNTTKDANGNLKAASPIVKVFADHVDPNEEAEGVTLKKLHTGIYQLHGVLGLHSDASWGGVNGGITIPCGINQLPLVYALYDVLEKGKPHPFDGRIVEPDEDGDIVLYTTYRKHDLPQNIQYERFKLYPEFLKEVDGEKVELTPGEPCDIPVGHWVDVRVNMPSNSIYNQKQAEAERLAKLEAERLAEEEAGHGNGRGKRTITAMGNLQHQSI